MLHMYLYQILKARPAHTVLCKAGTVWAAGMAACLRGECDFFRTQELAGRTMLGHGSINQFLHLLAISACRLGHCFLPFIILCRLPCLFGLLLQFGRAPGRERGCQEW